MGVEGDRAGSYRSPRHASRSEDEQYLYIDRYVKVQDFPAHQVLNAKKHRKFSHIKR